MHGYQSLKKSIGFLPHRALYELLVLRSYSSVSRGKHFELVTVLALSRLSFDVTVCGGPKDRGIDFRGKWCLKDSYVPVVGQCRKYKKRLGPRHVREMEGVLGRESADTLGILVSSQGYTKDAHDTCMGSSYCLALAILRGSIDSDLELGSIDVMDAGAFEGGDIVNDCTLVEGLDAADEKTPSNSDCSIHTKCIRVTQEPHRSLESLREINYGSEAFGDHIEENQMRQTQPSSGSKIVFNNRSLSLSSTNYRSVSYEMKNGNDNIKNTLAGDSIRNASKADWNKDLITYGKITLFELNPAARKLLPHVFIGITYKGKHSRNPEIMFVEDDIVLHVKSE